MTRYRRAGSHWRLLVHTMLPGGHSGASHHVKSHVDEGVGRGLLSKEARAQVDEIGATYGITSIVPGTEFDELVVGRWLHVEQMSTDHYWMSVGGLHVNVVADRDGNPRSVLVELEDPQPGVRYRVGGEELT